MFSVCALCVSTAAFHFPLESNYAATAAAAATCNSRDPIRASLHNFFPPSFSVLVSWIAGGCGQSEVEGQALKPLNCTNGWKRRGGTPVTGRSAGFCFHGVLRKAESPHGTFVFTWEMSVCEPSVCAVMALCVCCYFSNQPGTWMRLLRFMVQIHDADP